MSVFPAEACCPGACPVSGAGFSCRQGQFRIGAGFMGAFPELLDQASLLPVSARDYRSAGLLMAGVSLILHLSALLPA